MVQTRRRSGRHSQARCNGSDANGVSLKRPASAAAEPRSATDVDIVRIAKQRDDALASVQDVQRHMEAQQRLINILKERVETTKVLMQADMDQARQYTSDALQCRETEVAKLRLELARAQIERAELDFKVKSLSVELKECRDRSGGNNTLVSELKQELLNLRRKFRASERKLANSRRATEKLNDTHVVELNRERRARERSERLLQEYRSKYAASRTHYVAADIDSDISPVRANAMDGKPYRNGGERTATEGPTLELHAMRSGEETVPRKRSRRVDY